MKHGRNAAVGQTRLAPHGREPVAIIGRAGFIHQQYDFASSPARPQHGLNGRAGRT